MDEKNPHAHALIFPLIDGKLQGDKLKGGLQKIRERYNSYYKDVAINYGFNTPKKHQIDQTEKKALARKAMNSLSKDSLYDSKNFSWIRDAIFNDPTSLAELLGIEIKDPKKTITKSFIDIKRSKGHGLFIH